MDTRKNVRALLLAGSLLALAVVACKLPGAETGREVAAPATPPGGEIRPTRPAQPTLTPVPDVSGPGGCTLNSAFVEDVTIPDGTEMPPGKPFTKSWRVRNTGACPWKQGARLTFVSGDQMGGPAAEPVGPVAPGSGAVISIDLVAPSSPGTYKGHWQLQAPDGTAFGSVIYVEIVVPAAPAPTSTPSGNPPATPAPTSAPAEPRVTIELDASNSGSSGYPQARPGDDSSDSRVVGYLSWDLGAIPAGAEIVSAEIVWGAQCFEGGDVGDCTGARNPFPALGNPNLGYLEIKHYHYGSLANPPSVMLDPSLISPIQVYSSQPTGSLDVTNEVADDFADGDPFQLRITFEEATDNDGLGDGLIFVEGSGPNRLEVVYTMP